MKKIILLLLIVTISGCEESVELIKAISDESNRCNQYIVKYHTTNNCNNPIETEVYLTPEEFQRLYDIVNNASQNCVFVSISPKDGSPIRTGYIKDLDSFFKITLSGSQTCN